MQIETTFFDVGTQSEIEANQKLCYCMIKALFYTLIAVTLQRKSIEF